MPTGTAWPNSGNVALWHLNYKINSPDRGFNMGFKVAESTEANARVVALKLAAYIKQLMAPDSEVFYATMSRDDHKRDSRFLPSALGPGGANALASGTGDTDVNVSRDAALFRLESTDGTAVPMKFAPMPDDEIEAGAFKVRPPAVVGMPSAMPADPVLTDAWPAVFNKFMQVVVFGTHHIEGTHPPGGVYTYDTWINAYALRVCVKKGGRIFI